MGANEDILTLSPGPVKDGLRPTGVRRRLGAFVAFTAVSLWACSGSIAPAESKQGPPAGSTVQVSISPRSALLALSGSIAFSAAVTGTADTSVAWSVEEGTAGGTVSGTGAYTAPPRAGIYHVVVASRVDPARSDRATLTVAEASPPPAGTLVGAGWTGSTSLLEYPKTGPITTGGAIFEIDKAPYATPLDGLEAALAALSTSSRVFIRNDSNATVMLTAAITRATAWATMKQVFAYGNQRIKLDASGVGNDNTLRFGSTSTNEHWKGFEIVGATPYAWRPVVLADTASNITIEDFWVHDNPGHAANGGGVTGFSANGATDVVFKDCLYYNNTVGSGTNAGDGFAATRNDSSQGSTNIKFVRCFSAHAGDDGYDFYWSTGTEAIDCVAVNAGRKLDGSFSTGDGNAYKMGDNTNPMAGANHVIGSIALFARNDTQNWTGSGFYANGETGPLQAIHGTAYGCTGPGVSLYTNTTMCSDNISWNNGQANDGGNGTVLRNSWQSPYNGADPKFADPANGDFSLLPSSPYLTAGNGGVPLGASIIALQLLKDNWARR